MRLLCIVDGWVYGSAFRFRDCFRSTFFEPQDYSGLSAGKMPIFDCSKVKKELGLDFLPMRKSAQDMAAALIQLGIVPKLPGAPAQAKL